VTTRPRWRPRWYHWTVVALLVLVTTPIAVGIALRAAGLAACDRVLTELRAAGEPTAVGELTATWPTTDPVRQAALAAWLDDLETITDDPTADATWTQWVYRRAQPTPAMVAMASRHRPLVETGRTLLRGGPLHVGAVGWLAEHGANQRSRLPTRATWELRRYLGLLRFEALARERPDDALRDLDLLIDAVRVCATCDDAPAALSLAAVRDLAYVECLIHHRMGREALGDWLDEAPWQRLATADAMRGERVQVARSIAAMRQALIPDSVALSGIHDGKLPWGLRLYGAVLAPRNAAIVLRHEWTHEAILRGRPATAPDWRSLGAFRDHWARWSLATENELIHDAWLAEARHRAMRLAAELIVLVRDRDPAPTRAEIETLVPDLATRLAGSGWEASLRMAQEGDRTWRIAVDPLTPMPDAIVTNRGRIGAWKFTRPLQAHGPGCLVEVPAPRGGEPGRINPDN